MASSKAEKRREIVRRRREMIRKRTRTIFNKCYELCTKTSLQVAVVTYDEIQSSYRVFRTSPMFMATIMREIKRECPLVEDLVAGLTIFANNEGIYQGESSVESNEEGDFRKQLEDIVLEHDLLQNQEQESPPAESEVTQEQHGAVLMEDDRMVMEVHAVNDEIADRAEQRPEDESRNHEDRPPATAFDPRVLQPRLGNQRAIKGTGLKFLQEPPLWNEGETGRHTVRSFLQAPPIWEAV